MNLHHPRETTPFTGRLVAATIILENHQNALRFRHYRVREVFDLGAKMITGNGNNFWRIFGWIIILMVVGFIVAGLWAMTSVMPAKS